MAMQKHSMLVSMRANDFANPCQMASQACGGNLLAGSGWERMFSQANVFTSGVASSLLGCKNVK